MEVSYGPGHRVYSVGHLVVAMYNRPKKKMKLFTNPRDISGSISAVNTALSECGYKERMVLSGGSVHLLHSEIDFCQGVIL